MNNTLRLLPGALLLLGCAAACGSQTAVARPAPAASSAAGAAAAQPGSDQAGDSSSGGTDAGAQPADPGSSSADAPAPAGGDSSAFCTEARTLDSEGRLELTAADEQSVQELDKMTGLAPHEIAADMREFDKLAHQVVSDNPDPAAIEAITSPDELARIQRIQDYLGRHCGIAAEQD